MSVPGREDRVAVHLVMMEHKKTEPAPVITSTYARLERVSVIQNQAARRRPTRQPVAERSARSLLK